MKETVYSVVVLLIVSFLLTFALAHGDEEFSQAEEIIKQKVSCEQLSENQLEVLGDYYMEQMHPGEAHKYMDEMMGGESSESLRQAHINLGLAFYCGEHQDFSGNMMDVMMSRNAMMGGYYLTSYGTSSQTTLWDFLNKVLFVLILISIILLVVNLVRKSSGRVK